MDEVALSLLRKKIVNAFEEQTQIQQRKFGTYEDEYTGRLGF